MANIEINQLPAASSLTGSEEIPMDQSSDTVKTTAQDIADLAIQDLQSVLNENNLAIDKTIKLRANVTGQPQVINSIVELTTDSLHFQKQLPNNDINGTLFDTYVKRSLNPTGFGNVVYLPTQNGTLALLSDIPPAATLQSVTDGGNNETTNSIIVIDDIATICKQNSIGDNKVVLSQQSDNGRIEFYNSDNYQTNLKNTLATDTREIELPDDSGILAVSTIVGYSGSKTIGGQVYTWENGILISVV